MDLGLYRYPGTECSNLWCFNHNFASFAVIKEYDDLNFASR